MDREDKNGHTILVVDDDEEFRALLGAWLDKRGYRMAEAENGREAVDVALREHPELILMDLRMPVLNGINATQRLREHDELRDIPIVVTSALDPALFRDAAYSVGCTAYLTKPIDLAELENLLRRLLIK